MRKRSLLTGLDSVIKDIAHDLKFEDKMEQVMLYRLWKDAVGDAVARNASPVLVRGGDDGIWRRFIMMHLRMKFEGKAKDMVLKSKLMAELSGILNWAIAGCWDWQRKGLAVPQSLLDEVIDYRENSDQLGSFLAENVQPMVGMVIMLKDLREKVIT